MSKSNHKHLYSTCLLIFPNSCIAQSQYCTICNKVGKTNFFLTEKTHDGHSRLLSNEEVLQRFFDLPRFHVDNKTKYVTGGN